MVTVEATRLPMTESRKVWPEDAEEDCATESCDAVYAWEHSRESDQIYCGAAGDSLKVSIEVQDQEGWIARGTLNAKTEE